MPITHKATLPLCRPGEPSFMQKMNCRFDIPADHLPPRYKDLGVDILERFNDENVHKLPVKPIVYPNLEFLKTFEKNANFSTFIPQHMTYAKALMKIFDSAKDLDELISLALYCRDQVNSQLFIYAYFVVLTHRYDTDNIELPQLFEIAPHRFFKKSTLVEVREKQHSSAVAKRNRRQANTDDEPSIEVPFRGTMSVSNVEEKLAFFREDIGVNSHHWHWHVVYPVDASNPVYFDKDRRGELFYYMHHQLLNWYDCTRMALGVPMVLPFDNFQKQINGGYFPNMTTASSSFIIPPRPPGFMQDLHSDSNGVNLKVADLERWYQRFHEAIDNGFCFDSQGNRIDLINDGGIDILGNMVEANALSKNYGYNGNLHNSGHVMTSSMHDPDGKHKEPPGVMGDTTTAMRDPLFFRWHKMVDQLFTKLKDRLPPYQEADLQFKDITIKSLNILDGSNQSTEQLITFWQKSTVNLQNGLNFHRSEPILVTFTHLNYQHFSYLFEVENGNSAPVDGTVRIYLLPIKSDKGDPLLFAGSRKLAMEIDRFQATFPPGTSKLMRKSIDSSVTIPYDRTFPMQRDENVFLSDQPEDVQTICMCGWPQHMLLPKGPEDGYPYRIFAMISDYKFDKVDQEPSNGVCNDNYIMCGLRNRKYPDRRPLGFPFDRPAADGVTTVDDFVSYFNNMIAKQITIRHLNENKAQGGDNKTVKL
ncbi:phenoloxidase subunit 1-like [Sitodiplosis mosellana]|uniref:phenoloxidase subunit 1-like n=1 Tax=Sitodiplosis mosellana TaxID=263140 RepID=UPI002443D09C|nr:phenoloxidase subunit 1-like [Sitodiplosis mosellana]